MATLYEKLKKIDNLKQHKRKSDQLREVEDFTIRSIFQASYGKNIDFKMVFQGFSVSEVENIAF